MPSDPLSIPTPGTPARILVAVDRASAATLQATSPGGSARFDFVDDADAAVEWALASDYDLVLLGWDLDGIGAVAAADILQRAGAGGRRVAVGAGVATESGGAFDHHLPLPLSCDAVAALLESTLGARRPDPRWCDGWIARECADLVAEFRAGLPATAAALRQASDRRDPVALKAIVHALKGSAGAYGFAQATQDCAAIEADIRLGRIDAALAAAAALATDLGREPEGRPAPR